MIRSRNFIISKVLRSKTLSLPKTSFSRASLPLFRRTLIAIPLRHNSHLFSTLACPDDKHQESLTSDVPGATKGDEFMIAMFTCKVCETRSARKISKIAFHHGSVLVRCPGCKNLHVLSDHQGFFDDNEIDIEKMLRERGEKVQRGILPAGSDENVFELSELDKYILSSTKSKSVRLSDMQEMDIVTMRNSVGGSKDHSVKSDDQQDSFSFDTTASDSFEEDQQDSYEHIPVLVQLRELKFGADCESSGTIFAGFPSLSDDTLLNALKNNTSLSYSGASNDCLQTLISKMPTVQSESRIFEKFAAEGAHYLGVDTSTTESGKPLRALLSLSGELKDTKMYDVISIHFKQ